jgi:hypothetical protein
MGSYNKAATIGEMASRDSALASGLPWIECGHTGRGEMAENAGHNCEAVLKSDGGDQQVGTVMTQGS